jgi:hypothetical protein
MLEVAGRDDEDITHDPLRMGNAVTESMTGISGDFRTDACSKRRFESELLLPGWSFCGINMHT